MSDRSAHVMSDAASVAFSRLVPCSAPACEDGVLFGEDTCETCGGSGRVMPIVEVPRAE